MGVVQRHDAACFDIPEPVAAQRSPPPAEDEAEDAAAVSGESDSKDADSRGSSEGSGSAGDYGGAVGDGAEVQSAPGRQPGTHAAWARASQLAAGTRAPKQPARKPLASLSCNK